jgi:hypothetical protein
MTKDLYLLVVVFMHRCVVFLHVNTATPFLIEVREKEKKLHAPKT